MEGASRRQGEMGRVTPSSRATASLCRPQGAPGPSVELCPALEHSLRVLQPTTRDRLERTV